MRLTTTNFLFPLLVSAFIYVLPSSVHSSDADMLIDYAPIIAKCCGVKDEPSILYHCGEEYSAVRVTEGAGGYPIGLLRIVTTRWGAPYKEIIQKLQVTNRIERVETLGFGMGRIAAAIADFRFLDVRIQEFRLDATRAFRLDRGVRGGPISLYLDKSEARQ